MPALRDGSPHRPAPLTAPHPSAPGRTDWPLIAALYALGLLAAAQFAKIALALGPLGAAYPGAPVALAVSALGLVGLIFGVMAGGLVARVGLARALLWPCVAGGALSLVQAAGAASGWPFGALMATRLLEGAAHLGIVVTAPVLMAVAASDGARPVVMGLWGTFFGMGFALSALAAPALLGLGGVPVLFAAHGLALWAVALILWPRVPRAVIERRPNAPAPREGVIAAHRTTYGSLRIAAPAAGFFWHTLLFLALLTYLPANLPAGAAAVLPLVALAGTMAGGAAARRIAPPRVAMAAFAAAIPLALLLFAVPEPARYPLALLTLTVIAIVPGASFATVPWLNPAPADQARASGAVAQLGNLGTTAGTPILALLMPLGAGTAITAFTLVCCAGGLATLALIHARPNSGPPD